MIEEVAHNPDAAERRELLDVLALAFRDNPMNVEIHGSSVARRVRANRAGLRSLILDTENFADARVICHQGRVVGGFVALPPDVPFLPGPVFWRQVGCFLHQGARAMDRWGQVNRNLSAFRPAGQHWYLSVLGVSPAMQGAGVGGQLIEALIEMVSAEPAPIYLESDRPESVDFYRARGFEDREEVRVHNVSCWCLGRGFG
jgi:GNAT superfamily N-acetyltransferase